MATFRDRPLLTTVYSGVDEFVPSPSTTYIHGVSVEERSEHSTEWQTLAKDVEFIGIEDQQMSRFTATVSGTVKQVFLRSQAQILDFVSAIRSHETYLDITGLSHQTWAPVLRGLLQNKVPTKVVYVEPSDYRFSITPTEGEIFDLSERILGVEPIPGFASLSTSGDDNVCFIPLLGFEGTRLAYIIEQVQPPGGKIIPIVGIPGFRPQYPFYSYLGNQSALMQTRGWKDIRYASANCPFSLFYALEDIAKQYPNDRLKIAPIGTKPHAVGAILYYLATSASVEIVYDHPIRKAQRTEGTARLLVYDVSKLRLTS